MIDSFSISPRPLERVTLAKESAYKNLSQKLTKHHGLDEIQANALARACVDPAEVRNQLDRPLIKRFPGGSALMVETLVYTSAVSASPINPRESETRVYPIATPFGEPIIAPLPVEPVKNGAPVMQLSANDRSHMEQILSQSEHHLRSETELRRKIELDGILEPITVILAEIIHHDGEAAIVVPIAIDGSTRITHCHDLTNLTSIDVVYKWPKASNRAWRGMLNQRLAVQDRPLDDVEGSELLSHRAMVAPGRIIIGLDTVRDGEPIDIVTASRAIVGQIHVGQPKVWSQGAQNDEIAEAILDRLVRDSKINPAERKYLAGLIPPFELQQLGFSEYPDIRAARIAQVLYNRRNEASVSAGYRSLVAKVRLGNDDKPAVVTELILRAFRTDIKPSDLKNIRLTLQRTINLPEWRDTSKWSVRHIPPDDLLNQALQELHSNSGNPGPASLELGILGTYWLISRQALRSDSRDSSDRRSGAGVIRAMLQTERGLRQFHRAILDGRSDAPILAVAADGGLLPLAGGGGHTKLDNSWLRKTFSDSNDETDQDANESDIAKLNRALPNLRRLVDELHDTTHRISPAAEREGVDKQIVDEFREKLRTIDDHFGLWGLVASSKRGQLSMFEDTEMEAVEAS